MGMIALIGKAHNKIGDRPRFNFKINFVHDWVGFFKPFLKPNQVRVSRANIFPIQYLSTVEC